MIIDQPAEHNDSLSSIDSDAIEEEGKQKIALEKVDIET